MGNYVVADSLKRREKIDARQDARDARAETDDQADAGGNRRQVSRKKDASVLKPDVLSLEEGVTGFDLWSRRLRTWFTGAGYGDADVYDEDERKEFFLRYLDSEINGRFADSWASTENKECSVTNLLSVLSKVFEEQWPLADRRWKCFEFRQGKASFASWFPKMRQQFEEAQWEKMNMEALK